MDVQKEKFNTSKAVVSERNEIDYDWDIIVPDMKPDIGAVLSSGASVIVSESEIMQDRAVISGVVKINIMYIPAEDTKVIRNIESAQSFTHVMELKGLRQSMVLNISSEIVKVSENVINSRKVNLAAKIALSGAAYSESFVEFVSSAQEDGIQCLTKNISTVKTSPVIQNDFKVKEELEIPAGKPSVFEILKINTSIINKSVKPLLNKIVVKGNIILSALYNCETETMSFDTAEFDIPFTEIFDIEGLTENCSCDTDFEIFDVNWFMKENSDGEKRVLCAEIIVRVRTKSYESITLNALVDAYSTKCNMKCERQSCNIDEIIGEFKREIPICENVRLEDMPPINRILCYNAKNKINNASMSKGRIKIEGTITSEVIYCSIDQQNYLNCARFETPYSNEFECDKAEAGLICDIKADVLNVGFNVTGDFEIQIKMLLEVCGRIKKICSGTFFKELSVDEDSKFENNRPDIVVYVCDGCESMWEIAKKYRTTVEKIAQVNECGCDTNPCKGTKLIV